MKSLFAGLGLSTLLTACGADTSAITSLNGDHTRGAALYQTNCAGCHGATGGEAARKAKSDPDEAASVILAGKESMPGFEGTLTNQEIADILAHLAML
jgi:mono/diheme cytochrome c family protein